MLNTKQFGQLLQKHGFKFFSGVPCSFLKYLINYAINDLNYVAAANEGDAVAISAGAYLGGLKSAVLMQNSGLTNAISPLTSLNYPFKIPVLGFVSLRGEPGLKDEPQHELMGEVTTDFLDTMKIKWKFLSDDLEVVSQQMDDANQTIESKESFFFVVKKGTFAEEKLDTQNQFDPQNQKKCLQQKPPKLETRNTVLEQINTFGDESTIFLASTGKGGRELYEIEDRAGNLYMVGSMGAISSIGLGLALAKPHKNIIAIDGDGALLMRMGSLATNAAYGPKNLLHILLDNSSHDSTGGQMTVSNGVNFVEVAAACGYTRSLFAHDCDELMQFMKEWKAEKALTFIHMKITKGSKKDLGRPKIKPYEVKERLMKFLG